LVGLETDLGRFAMHSQVHNRAELGKYFPQFVFGSCAWQIAEEQLVGIQLTEVGRLRTSPVF